MTIPAACTRLVRPRVLRVLGGPGTGKSTVAVELVVEAGARGARADECLVVAATRTAAGRVCDSG